MAEIAHQAQGTNHFFVWEKRHPERRKESANWSPSEWGNFFADGLAEAIGSSYQFAPQLPNASSLMLHLPDGSLHGNIKRILPPIITSANGPHQLAHYIHYDNEQVDEVDWDLLQLCSTGTFSLLQILQQPMVHGCTGQQIQQLTGSDFLLLS